MNLRQWFTQVRASRTWAILAVLHKKVDTYFAYLVAASVALQEGWANFEAYVPVRLRHIVLGMAAGFVLAGHIWDAVKRVNAMLDAPGG